MASRSTYNVRLDTSGSKALKSAVEKMKGAYVTVGVHNDAGTYDDEEGKQTVPVSTVAFWLENGTQRMPARPFFGPTLLSRADKIKQLSAKSLAMVMHGESPVHALSVIGFQVQTWVQNAIKSNIAPALSAEYLRARRRRYPSSGSRTLIASGLLLRSIRYVVTDGAGNSTKGPEEGPQSSDAKSQAGKQHKADDAGKAAREQARVAAREHIQQQKVRRAQRRPKPVREKFYNDRQVVEPPTKGRPT